MNAKIREKLARDKRRIERRLDKNNNTGCERPMFTAANIDYELADRTRAIAAGGLGMMHLVARKLGLVEAIDRSLQLLKVHLPYHESDHVLNIACKLLAGGGCRSVVNAPPQKPESGRFGPPPRLTPKVHTTAKPTIRFTTSQPTTFGPFTMRRETRQ